MKREDLSGVLDDLTKLASDREEVSISDIREAFGSRSFGPFLLLPALLEISPIGGIPGLPTVLAAVVALFAVQIAFGAKHLWLPDFLERRTLNAAKFRKAMDWLKPIARWTDKVVRPRMKWATQRPWLNVLALICIALAATVPPLEVVPFASTLPMAAIALFGLAILVKDGVLAIIAALVSAGSFYALYSFVLAG